MRGLYAIVNVPDPHGHGVVALTSAVLGERARGGPGASVVQLRAKHASTDQRVAWLDQMAPLCEAASSLLIVNDDLDAARTHAGVHGVHVGQGDAGADDVAAMRTTVDRTLLIGLSTHDAGQLQRACQQQPDYVALGPIAPTRSKSNPDPVVGFAGLLEGCRLSTRPLVAIGGLDRVRGEQAIGLGASAVAVIGALQDPDLDTIRAQACTLAESFERAAAPLPFEEVCAALPIFSAEHLRDLASWSDDLSVHIGLGLPARFCPTLDGDEVRYRRSDLLDLLFVLDKRPAESWDEWSTRVDRGEIGGSLIQLSGTKR